MSRPAGATTLVIGFGNTLRGDDAIGRIAAARVRQVASETEIKVIDCCTPTPELAMEISRFERVVILDASVDGPAGTVVTRRLSGDVPVEALGHQLGPEALICLARQWFDADPQAFAITFRGEQFDISDYRLSPGAEAAIDDMVEETLRLARNATNRSTVPH